VHFTVEEETSLLVRVGMLNRIGVIDSSQGGSNKKISLGIKYVVFTDRLDNTTEQKILSDHC